MFRRRRRDDEGDDLDLDDEGFDGSDEEAPENSTAIGRDAVEPSSPGGPFDIADLPDDGLPRVDLGALQMVVPDGLEVRVDMQDQVVIAATVVDGNSAMQVHAFAAPRSAGIWTEVRDEIAESLREAGGSADHADGPFGAELHARVPVMPPPGSPPNAQASGLQPMRFIGVDGPRWFLRGLLTGPAATDPNQARRLLDVFRLTAVVRGGDAMAPREALPLRLPKEAMGQMPTPEPPARPGLEMLERGPEITETR